MKVRLRAMVTGTFHGIDGVQLGDVVDIDEANARRYAALGMVELVGDEEERAVVEPEKVETAVVKPKVGRPRKQPDWHDEDAPGWRKASEEQ